MVYFYSSQIGSIFITPLSYIKSPLKLFFADVWLVLKNLGYLLKVFIPRTPALSGELCELSFTWMNYRDLLLHAILIVLQLLFLLSIPIWILMPVWAVSVGFTAFWMFNYSICYILNGSRSARTYKSAPKYAQGGTKHARERWLYLNGICTGRHWLEGSVNRLALTFGRPVVGIHNRTNGLIFDIIECAIQRSFDFATTDIRTAYGILKGDLYNDRVERVILICHSQGGIEASIMIDRLLAEIPQDLVRKLEVYTFGNAANHFNNPHLRREYQRAALAQPASPAAGSNNPADPLTNQEMNGKSISHIEHYAHTFEIVSRIGILHFAKIQNDDNFAARFMGRIFEVKATGHMFVQHYLDTMFPLDPCWRNRLPGINRGSSTGPDDDNQSEPAAVDVSQFMQRVVEREGQVAPGNRLGREDWEVSITDPRGIENGPVNGMRIFRVKNLSRLRLYLNGKIPPGNVAGRE